MPLPFGGYSSASTELPSQGSGRLIPQPRKRAPTAVHAASPAPCKPCFLLRLNPICFKSTARMYQVPHAGSEKRSPAQGRWANTQCFLRRDSSRRCRARCRAKDELDVYGVQELYSHWRIHCSTWGEEWTPALPKAPIPLHNLCLPSLGVIQSSPLRLGAAGEPKLTLAGVWGCLLPFGCCLHLVHSIQLLGLVTVLATWLTESGVAGKCLKSPTTNPPALLPLLHLLESLWKNTTLQLCFQHCEARGYCVLLWQRPQQAFDFRLPSFFSSGFPSSKVAWPEKPIPPLMLLWRLHLYVGARPVAAHDPFENGAKPFKECTSLVPSSVQPV